MWVQERAGALEEAVVGWREGRAVGLGEREEGAEAQRGG